MNKFKKFFFHENKKCLIHKWHHYFEIYHHHFKRFIDTTPNILEVGVSEGGSLEMWDYYFDGKCNIYGIDINKNCLSVLEKLNKPNIQIEIGDQSDRGFWKNYLKDKPKFDIVIEDGGHTMIQQIVTFEELYDHVDENGVYLCEDVHTSYWLRHQGGYKNSKTFIEYSKNFIDGINSQHIQEKVNNINELKHIRATTKSIHYYDSVIVLEKGILPKSTHSKSLNN
jgi:hypothetical protein